jgi:hypothetical protein
MTCVRLPARRRTARPTVRGLRRAASAMAWWDRHRLFEDAHRSMADHAGTGLSMTIAISPL